MFLYFNREIAELKGNEENTTENTSVTNTIDDNNASSTTKKIKKVDENKELIYNIYSKNIAGYLYTIPCINIDSSEVEKINNEIENKYRPIISEIEVEDEQYGIDYTQNYNYYVNGDILSLVIEGEFSGGFNFDVYNVDIYTGQVVTNSDILKSKNLTAEEYTNKLPQLYKEKYIEIYGEMAEFDAAFYNEQLEKTIDPSNYSINTPIYLNNNGKIAIIANIYSLAGADSYNRIIDTNI